MKVRQAVDVAIAVLAVDAGVAAVNAVTRRDPAAAEPAPAARAVRPHGWKAGLVRVYTQIGDHRVMTEAAAVTYYSLLAIFPAIASLISLYGMVADPAVIGRDLSALNGVVPEGGMQIISDQVKALITAPHQALGFGFALGLLTSLWSANAGVKSLFDALNAVYGERETRSFLHRTWLSFAFTLGALAFIALAMTAVVVLPTLLNYVGLGLLATWLLSLGRWPLLLLAILLFLAFIYRFGPSRANSRWAWISWGSSFAAVTWILGSAGFSWYAANFGSYNKTYGSLGAVVGFMTWIWISTIIVLVGAELNAELEAET